MRRLFETKGFSRAVRQTALSGLLLSAFAGGLPATFTPAYAESSNAASSMRAGIDAIERGVYEKAILSFSAALESGELDRTAAAIAHHHRGVAYQKIEQPQPAIKDYTAAIESGGLPEKVLPKAYYNRGIALANTGQEAVAERDYLKALALDPEYAAAYHNLANLERRAGDYDAAIRHYSSAINHMDGGDRKLPLFGRALCYEQEGRLELAASDLRQVLALDPEFELAEARLNALSPMLTSTGYPAEKEASSPQVVPATLSPFQTAASGHERGQIIRVASIGGWRTTATRFTREKGENSGKPAAMADASPPEGELVTGSLRSSEQAVQKRPVELGGNVIETAPTTEGRYKVQLGAFRDEAVARQAWNELSADAGPVLGTSGPAIQRADLGDKGIFYRLQAGAFGEIAEAKSACKALEQRKIACFVVES